MFPPKNKTVPADIVENRNAISESKILLTLKKKYAQNTIAILSLWMTNCP